MAESNRKGMWIPLDILRQPIPPLDKMLLTEIWALDLTDRGCFKSNKAFAELLNCSTKSITRAVLKLHEMGYISVEYVGSINGTERRIRIAFTINDYR